jgi:hypothetical protein
VWRNDSHGPYLSVREDLDGDGKQDLAELVVSEAENALAVRVLLSSLPDRAFFAAREPTADAAAVMGLGVVVPGEYKTACGKGYWVCEAGEPAVLSLAHPTLDFFRFGSANTFLVWSREEKSFKRVWMSD